MKITGDINNKIINFRVDHPEKRIPLPFEIKKEIIELSKTHSYSAIARELDIPVTTIYGWSKKLSGTKKKQPRQKTGRSSLKPTDFVEIKPPLAPLSPFQNGAEVFEMEFERGSGRIKMRIPREQGDLVAIIFKTMMSI